MRLSKDGNTYTLDSWVMVPMEVTIPEHVAVVEGEEVVVEATTEMQDFQKQLRDLTPEERTALGYVEIEEEAPFDSRYYFSAGVARPIEQLKAMRIAEIKAVAGGLILDFCPQWKQANLTAQAAELALTFPGTAGADLDEPYHTAWSAGQAIWNHIKAIRTQSDTLEAEVNALSTAEDVIAWQMHDWPTQEE